MLLIDKLWSFNISLSYPFHPPELGAAKKKQEGRSGASRSERPQQRASDTTFTPFGPCCLSHQVITVIAITRCQKSWQSAKIGARVNGVKSTKRQVGK